MRQLFSGAFITLSMLLFSQAQAETWSADASVSGVTESGIFTVTVRVTSQTGDYDLPPQTTFALNSTYFQITGTEVLSLTPTSSSCGAGNIVFAPPASSPPVGTTTDVCRYTIQALQETGGSPQPVFASTSPTWTSTPSVEVVPAPAFVTINVAANPTVGGSASCNPNPVVQGDDSFCTATPNPGYTFTGWSGDCSGMSCVLTDVQSVQSVTANFQINEYPITVTTVPAGVGSASCSPNPVTHGGNSSCIAALPPPGYINFISWSGDCTASGDAATTTCELNNVQGPQSVTLTYFQTTAYPITVTANPANGGSASCTPNPVQQGDDSACTATPNQGFTFTGWSGDCSGTSCVLTNVQGAQSVTANFQAQTTTYPITTLAIPANGGSISCTPNPVPAGGSTACTITPAPGYALAPGNPYEVELTGPTTGSCGGPTGNCTFSNVGGAISLTVRFQAVITTYPITVTANPANGGSLNPCHLPTPHPCDALFEKFACPFGGRLGVSPDSPLDGAVSAS